MNLLQARKIGAVLFGIMCESYSVAHGNHGKGFRTWAHTSGDPSVLSREAMHFFREHDLVRRFMIKVVRVCLAMGIPFIVENPSAT